MSVTKRLLLSFLLVILIFSQAGAFRSDWNDCAQARRNLTRSGMATDAKESLWGGRVKPREPRNEFSPDDDKISWWGEFKPFETWGRMETDVRWVDPYGNVVKQERVQGGKCRMMKASLSPRELPFRMVDGVWLIEVGCADDPVDVKRFAVRGALPVEPGVYIPSAPTGYREMIVDKKKN